MKRFLFAAASIVVLSSLAYTQNGSCWEDAQIPEPGISEAARTEYEKNLALAQANFEKDPENVENAIWLGRRTAYLSQYKEAIAIYTQAIEKHPDDARLRRHRGHRYISIRCLNDAIYDLKKAAEMVKGKPDEVEPDGLPNARNIPTSTLQSNIFYHLGLAYYLKGDYENALKAYEECLKVSKNPDMFVATQNWHYLTLMRLWKKKEAEKVLASVKDGLDVIENDSYCKLLKLYAGKIKPETLLTEIREGEDGLQNATMGYGIGTYFLINGDKDKAEAIYQKIVETNQWASFGYIAAESELKRVG
ncbi:MAG: tetratricopeptide repeat protein [Acidobacteria bacterium]|nr:MAG: tetratricopeptide repeat protein [Acidobacteriota bacterium]REK03911.1 MAG: tetratricopeptide repeat protein [Acidobacteriota bacterium]REK15073.1 MAG: tetratricopeptide repeat protein [Acidobacteriota bacterium]REK46163.1 MAG: tetratricopeptide repeat protein [Acidobacteriota bacterium]